MDGEWPLHALSDHLESLIAVAGNAYDDRFIAGNPPLLDELLGHCHFGSTRRLGKDSLSSGEELDGVLGSLRQWRSLPTLPIPVRP